KITSPNQSTKSLYEASLSHPTASTSRGQPPATSTSNLEDSTHHSEAKSSLARD
ncbi:hypothetical protein L7F22_055777, partial [Adiantum nelumboides]|nr:hypothetical protein [Adiantum nelumboides]